MLLSSGIDFLHEHRIILQSFKRGQVDIIRKCGESSVRKVILCQANACPNRAVLTQQTFEQLRWKSPSSLPIPQTYQPATFMCWVSSYKLIQRLKLMCTIDCTHLLRERDIRDAFSLGNMFFETRRKCRNVTSIYFFNVN